MTLVRIDDIQGRLDDCFTYPGGPTVHPFTFRSVLGREREHRRVPGAPDGARRRRPGPLPGRPSTRRASRETIRGALVDLGLAGAEVSVTPVDALERQTTGKLRRFVPLAAPTR